MFCVFHSLIMINRLNFTRGRRKWRLTDAAKPPPLQRLRGKAAKWKGKREKMRDFTTRSTSPRDKEGAERKRVSFHYKVDKRVSSMLRGMNVVSRNLVLTVQPSRLDVSRLSTTVSDACNMQLSRGYACNFTKKIWTSNFFMSKIPACRGELDEMMKGDEWKVGKNKEGRGGGWIGESVTIENEMEERETESKCDWHWLPRLRTFWHIAMTWVDVF